MLRYKTETRPGLVALYDIQPGNGAGQFLQPRSPHGASGHDNGLCLLFQPRACSGHMIHCINWPLVGTETAKQLFHLDSH